MATSPGTFGPAEAAVRRGLVSTVRRRTFVAAVNVCVMIWMVYRAATPGLALPGTPVQSWAQSLVVAGACAVFLVGALRGIAACRRAPLELLGAEGVGAEVVYLGDFRMGNIGYRIDLRTQIGETVTITFLGGGGRRDVGDQGMLYRRGRYAAFVTDATTDWAV
jgi:hypothetical protein